MRMRVLCILFVCVGVVLGCKTDDDCSLNGVCTGGTCVCDVPWTGPECAKLAVGKARPGGLYGYDPNVTSWGGNIIEDASGLYHLFVAEMVNDCGLHTWGTNSQVAHATSHTLEGPYKRHDVSLPHEAHNPQAFFLAGEWYIFHIGGADNHSKLKNCTRGSMPFVEDGLGDDIPEITSHLHSSSSPNGPWTPVPNVPSCNNPSPFVRSSGEILLACTWSLYSAPHPSGPWHRINATFSPPHLNDRNWEDPFLWIDKRGHWHVLSHTWTKDPPPAITIAGHGYSRNGVLWQWSQTEPYGNPVHYTDGSVKSFATMERPKLLFDKSGVPTHLINGVSPVWPCGPCPWCSRCKVTLGHDWTYTLMRPLGH